eukprot:1158298-Pelagomonas_calceolata.AAC.11
MLPAHALGAVPHALGHTMLHALRPMHTHALGQTMLHALRPMHAHAPASALGHALGPMLHAHAPASALGHALGVLLLPAHQRWDLQCSFFSSHKAGARLEIM